MIEEHAGNFTPAFSSAILDLFRSEQHILYIGASVTAQKNSFVLSFHERICRATGHPHKASRIAVGGTGSLVQYWLYRQKHGGFDPKPRLVFFECLTGDLNGLVPEALLPPLLGGLANHVRGHGGELCVVNSHRTDRSMSSDMHQAYARAADFFSIPFVNLFNSFTPAMPDGLRLDDLFFRDGIHTTDAGSEILGSMLLAAVMSPRNHARPLPPDRSAELRHIVQALDGVRLLQDELRYTTPVDDLEVDSIETIPNGDVYSALVVPSDRRLSFRFTGYLAYLVFITGPDASVVDLTFGGIKRPMNVFDRHSYYRRFRISPIFRNIDDELIELQVSGRPIDLDLIPPEHRARIVNHRRIRFIGVIGVPGRFVEP